MKKNSRLLAFVTVILIYILAFCAASILYPLLPFSESIVNVLIADISATLVVFAFSIIFNNSSLYDPYWSVVPPIIVLYLMKQFPQGDHIRQLTILCLVLFWSIRLTVNWFRGWKGFRHQDWRYTKLEERYRKSYWPVSFLGIHLMPTIFVFMACLPLWYSLSADAPFNIYDMLAALFTLLAIITEWVADEQLIRFRKYGFPDSLMKYGLWTYSRHPNYLGEISFWTGLYLFVLSSGMLKSIRGLWTVIGVIGMIILFKFISIPMMEKRIMSGKSGYQEYANEVPALFPFLARRKK